MLVLSGDIKWQNLSQMAHREAHIPGILVNFPMYGYSTERRTSDAVSEALIRNNISFFRRIDARLWEVDFSELRKFFSLDGNENDWLYSKAVVEPEFNLHLNHEGKQEAALLFRFTKQEVEQMTQQKIFLSHSSADKPIVESTSRLLTTLGYQPWFDRDAMNAGATLERAILAGMKSSCAAVFFITPNYVDERYIAAEIEYAIGERRERGERFAIISILLDGATKVPDLLRPFVWKTPSNPVEMIDEIVKALPVGPSGIIWK